MCADCLISSGATHLTFPVGWQGLVMVMMCLGVQTRIRIRRDHNVGYCISIRGKVKRRSSQRISESASQRISESGYEPGRSRWQSN